MFLCVLWQVGPVLDLCCIFFNGGVWAVIESGSINRS